MNELNVGDLVEAEAVFGSPSIDHFFRENKICFLLVEKIEKFNYLLLEEETWFYSLPQFALNDEGLKALRQARETGYPHTRTGYWLLNSEKCKKINKLEQQS